MAIKYQDTNRKTHFFPHLGSPLFIDFFLTILIYLLYFLNTLLLFLDTQSDFSILSDL